MYFLLITWTAKRYTVHCSYMHLSPKRKSEVRVNEVPYTTTLKLSTLDILTHSLKYSSPFPILVNLNTSYLKRMTTKRLQMMKLTLPESAGCDVPVLKLEVLPHYQCKTAFEVSWKKLKSNDDWVHFLICDQTGSECWYTANLMRMLIFHFSLENSPQTDNDYVFIILA